MLHSDTQNFEVQIMKNLLTSVSKDYVPIRKLLGF